jgi:serine protease DegQ
MNLPATQLLLQFSNAVVALVAASAPMVTAIRVGPSRHITGIVWRADMVVTADQALPAQDSYSVALPGGELLPARASGRDPAANLATLTLDTSVTPTSLQGTTDIAVGALAVVLGAALDGSPTVRLTAIHRLEQTQINSIGAPGHVIALDLPGNLVNEGGPVLDARGGLIGMAITSPQGEAMVVPHAVIARFLDPLTTVRPVGQIGGRRGWLGVALQPINVPETLRPMVGQSSGRMVVSVTPNGPAEQAGLRVGDVLLAIDGQSVSGSNTLRAFLGQERIGTLLEVRLLRDGALRSVSLSLAAHPSE